MVIRGWLAACAFALQGCGGIGLLYTHTIEPYDLDMNRTLIGSAVARTSGITQVVEPLTGAQISLQLFSNALGDIYPKNNLQTGYYADLETQSVFLGVWQQHTIHVSGHPTARLLPH